MDVIVDDSSPLEERIDSNINIDLRSTYLAAVDFRLEVKPHYRFIMDELFRLLLLFSLIFFPYLLFKILSLAKDFVKTERGIGKLEVEYETLVGCRNDMLQHYSWSLEDGDKSASLDLKKSIIRITKEIDFLLNEFQTRFKKKKKAN